MWSGEVMRREVKLTLPGCPPCSGQCGAVGDSCFLRKVSLLGWGFCSLFCPPPTHPFIFFYSDLICIPSVSISDNLLSLFLARCPLQTPPEIVSFLLPFALSSMETQGAWERLEYRQDKPEDGITLTAVLEQQNNKKKNQEEK